MLIVTKHICDFLKDIEIKDFKLVSAIIKKPNGEECTDYWIANIYREFAFLDEDGFEFDGLTSSGRWNGIEKL